MTWKLCCVAIAAVTLGGCGDDTSNTTGTGGQGGTGGQTTGTNTGGGGAGGGQGGDGGMGGGAECGGLAGASCGPTEYCDFDDNTCGAADGIGVCRPRPQGCAEIYMPTCGCDGVVHGNPCEANAAGQDVSNLGGCEAPANQFGCGPIFCASNQQYCQRQVSDVGGEPDLYACVDLPPACPGGGGATCTCLDAEPCGDLCEEIGGQLKLTCPGG